MGQCSPIHMNRIIHIALTSSIEGMDRWSLALDVLPSSRAFNGWWMNYVSVKREKVDISNDDFEGLCESIDSLEKCELPSFQPPPSIRCDGERMRLSIVTRIESKSYHWDPIFSFSSGEKSLDELANWLTSKASLLQTRDEDAQGLRLY